MNGKNRDSTELMKQVLLLGQCSMTEHQFEAFRKMIMNLFHNFSKGKEQDQGSEMPLHDGRFGGHE